MTQERRKQEREPKERRRTAEAEYKELRREYQKELQGKDINTLRKIARDSGIRDWSEMNRGELIEKIQEHEDGLEELAREED